MRGLRANFHLQAVGCPDLFGGLSAASTSPGDSSRLGVAAHRLFKKSFSISESPPIFRDPTPSDPIFPRTAYGSPTEASAPSRAHMRERAGCARCPARTQA